MEKVDIEKVKSMTGDHHAWLMSYLKNKKAACAYLQITIDEYQTDGDQEVFVHALKDVLEAQSVVGKVNTNFSNDKYTYRIVWSEDDNEYAGLCAEFPSLSYLDKSQDKAFQGIRTLVTHPVPG